jgi:hypothetical protein
MKKFIVLLLLVAFLVPMTGVKAQDGTQSVTGAPGTWVASINIQNPSTSPAIVNISFYDATGGLALSFDVTPSIPAGGARSLYLPTDVTALGSGQFSAVASSDQPIQTVINLSSTVPYTVDSYVGVSQGGTKLYFPGAYNNYYGFNSELQLQNAGTDVASVSIQFYNQTTGAAVGSPYTSTIPVYATKTFGLAALTPALPSGNTNGLLAAVVTSGQPLAGIMNSWSAAVHGEFASYNGFVGGGTTAYAPALYREYYGFGSALTVQNIGTGPTNVTVTLSNGKVLTKTALAQNSSFQWYMPDKNLTGIPSGNTAGVFSAKIVSSAQPVVALVNSEAKTAGSLAQYDGSNAATATVLCPVVMKAYYQWFSAETVQNVGTLTTDITITYPGGYHKTATGVLPNGTVNFIELASAGSVLPDLSTLAATITSSNGQSLLAVVQENSNERNAAHPGDYLASYACSNQ